MSERDDDMSTPQCSMDVPREESPRRNQKIRLVVAEEDGGSDGDDASR